jgi:uncharacterized protein YegL
VTQALTGFIQKLRLDPWALEEAWLSLIIISDPPIQVFPLTKMTEINTGELLAVFATRKSCGSFGQALKLTTDCIQAQCRSTTPTQKGDYRPIVSLIVGYAHLLDIAEGTAILASVRPASSFVYSFSGITDRAVASFADFSTDLKADDSAEFLSEQLWMQWRAFWHDQDEIFEIEDSGEPRKNTRDWRNQSIPTTK